MEKLKAETQSVFKKVDVCPRCSAHLEIDIKRRKIDCPSCGLIIEIESQTNILRSWLIVAVFCTLLFGLGFFFLSL